MADGGITLSMKKKVSCVVPTFNGLSLIQANLPAVLSCLRDGDELVIVDDASNDGTVSWLQEELKLPSLNGVYKKGKKKINVQLLVNEKNLRFIQSANRGVLVAQNQLIFLLNNDVSPYRDALKYLVEYFDDSDVFAVGCLELESANGQKKSGKNRLWFDRGIYMHSRSADLISGETAWVSGGSGLFDKSKWLELGGFDRDYQPAYWEDIDLSFRARRKGWRVLFENKSVVHHHHESTNLDVFGRKKIEKISWRNAHRFVWKNGKWWQKLLNLFWRPYWFYKKTWS